jgi:hypothetical protein
MKYLACKDTEEGRTLFVCRNAGVLHWGGSAHAEVFNSKAGAKAAASMIDEGVPVLGSWTNSHVRLVALVPEEDGA